MGYRLIADAVAVAHFGFLVYLLVGGFLAWRWPRTIWLHLATAMWGLGITVIGWECPLTHAENWARTRAGDEALPTTGFIDHYIAGVVYPHPYERVAQVAVAVVVVVSWVGFAVRRRGRAR